MKIFRRFFVKIGAFFAENSAFFVKIRRFFVKIGAFFVKNSAFFVKIRHFLPEIRRFFAEFGCFLPEIWCIFCRMMPKTTRIMYSSV